MDLQSRNGEGGPSQFVQTFALGGEEMGLRRVECGGAEWDSCSGLGETGVQ